MAAKSKGEASTGAENAPDLADSMVRRDEGGGRESLQMLFEANASAPRRARRAAETLGDRLSPHGIASLRAVLSELVALCLSPSGRAPIEVRLQIQKSCIRGEVRRSDGPTGEIGGSGHALRIIGALVEEWGITAGQANAWFRMAVPD